MTSKFKMMAMLIGLIATALVLSSCGPMYSTSYSYVPPRSWRGKQCVNQCMMQQTTCKMQCKLSDQECHMNANMIARPAYRAYVRQQARAKQPIKKTIRDFADYSSCADSCGCVNLYRQCYTNCGGQVVARTVCVAFCNKK